MRHLPKVRVAELQGVLDDVSYMEQSKWTAEHISALRQASRIIAQHLPHDSITVNGHAYRGLDRHEYNSDASASWSLLVHVREPIPARRVLLWNTSGGERLVRHDVTSFLQPGLLANHAGEVADFVRDAYQLCHELDAFAPRLVSTPTTAIPAPRVPLVDLSTPRVVTRSTTGTEATL